MLASARQNITLRMLVSNQGVHARACPLRAAHAARWLLRRQALCNSVAADRRLRISRHVLMMPLCRARLALVVHRC